MSKCKCNTWTHWFKHNRDKWRLHKCSWAESSLWLFLQLPLLFLLLCCDKWGKRFWGEKQLVKTCQNCSEWLKTSIRALWTRRNAWSLHSASPFKCKTQLFVKKGKKILWPRQKSFDPLLWHVIQKVQFSPQTSKFSRDSQYQGFNHFLQQYAF